MRRASRGEILVSVATEPGGELGLRLRSLLLAAYIAALPLSMLTIGSVGSALKAFSVILAGFAILDLAVTHDVVRRFGAAEVAWLAYVAYMVTSLLWDAGTVGVATTVGMIQLTAIALLLTRIPWSDRLRTVVEVSWLTCASICALLLAFSGGRLEYVERAVILLPGGGSDANELCAYFVVPLAILGDRLVSLRSSWSRLWASILISVFAFCVVSTGSRGGLIACLVSFVISVVLALKRRGVIKALGGLVTMAATVMVTLAVGALQLFPDKVLARLSLAALAEDGGSGRDVIWRESWNLMMAEGPRVFFGFGPFGNQVTGPTMHNQFLQSFVDGGLIGAVLFVWLCLSLLKRSSLVSVYLAALVGTLTILLTLSASASFKPVWAVFMICLLPRRFPPAGGFQANVAEVPLHPSPDRI